MLCVAWMNTFLLHQKALETEDQINTERKSQLH